MKPCMHFLIAAFFFIMTALPLYSEEMYKTVDLYVKKLGIDPGKSIEDNIRYRNLLIERAGVKELSLTCFGSLGYDTFKNDSYGKMCGVVGSPIEYYYTDLVFIKQDYMAALKTLFSQRVEEPEKIAECSDAIKYIIELAGRRGVTIKPADAEAIWKNEKTSEIMYYARTSNCSEEGIKYIIDFYFGGSGYQKFTARLKSLQEKDIMAAMSVLAVIGSQNRRLEERLSVQLGQ